MIIFLEILEAGKFIDGFWGRFRPFSHRAAGSGQFLSFDQDHTSRNLSDKT